MKVKKTSKISFKFLFGIISVEPTKETQKLNDPKIWLQLNFKVIIQTINYRWQGQLLSLAIVSIDSFGKKTIVQRQQLMIIDYYYFIIYLCIDRICFASIFAICNKLRYISNGIKLIKWTGKRSKQLKKKVQQFHFQLGMK